MGDDLGDRMKGYEARETDRAFLPYIPVYARIDGRCFSAFTRGMQRPYDVSMSDAMIAVTKALVDKTNAICGYTQSDEISLAWLQADPKSEIFFAGKTQKMVSILASMATAEFMIEAMQRWPERVERRPTFDCRVFQLPNLAEGANVFLWRERDAVKNAISMAARHYYSHNELHLKPGSEMQEMLFAKGINFNDYPAFFKRGTFLQRRHVLREMTAEELALIPEQHRPTGPIERSEVRRIPMPAFNKVTNRVRVIFHCEDPVTASPLVPTGALGQGQSSAPKPSRSGGEG